MIRAAWIDLGLCGGVLMALAAVAGMLIAKTVYDRLHYITLLTSVSAPCIGAAVGLGESFSPAGWKALFTAAILFWISAALTHATARAARIHQGQDAWRRARTKNIPLAGGSS